MDGQLTIDDLGPAEGLDLDDRILNKPGRILKRQLLKLFKGEGVLSMSELREAQQHRKCERYSDD